MDISRGRIHDIKQTLPTINCILVYTQKPETELKMLSALISIPLLLASVAQASPLGPELSARANREPFTQSDAERKS